MQLSELVSAVENVVLDSFYTSTKITALINEAVLKIATGDAVPGKFEKSPPLPGLYTTDTIDTTLSAGIANLPSDFNRDLIQVVNSDDESLPIMPSARKFLKQYPEESAGSVFKCAVMGKRLLYRDIPAAAETLTCHYYSTPTTLSVNDDEPTEIPAHLHRKLIVGYVCREIFNQIEDGVDGQKINTAFYNAEYQKGLLELELEIGTDHDPDYYDLQTDYCP